MRRERAAPKVRAAQGLATYGIEVAEFTGPLAAAGTMTHPTRSGAMIINSVGIFFVDTPKSGVVYLPGGGSRDLGSAVGVRSSLIAHEYAHYQSNHSGFIKADNPDSRLSQEQQEAAMNANAANNRALFDACY